MMISTLETHGISPSAASPCLRRRAAALAQDRFIIVASTTSTEQSGLFGYLLPIFEEETGIDGARRRAGHRPGAGHRPPRRCRRRLRACPARRSTSSWRRATASSAYAVMYNDFVIVGPEADPAGIAGGKDALAGLKKIAGERARPSPRGATIPARTRRSCGSGRRRASLRRVTGIARRDPAWDRRSTRRRRCPPTLLTDRGTWISFQNRGPLEIVVRGRRAPVQPYGVILVDPQRHPHVKAEDGQAFIDWLVSDAGQEAIAGYKIDGEQLFFPNADPSGS